MQLSRATLVVLRQVECLLDAALGGHLQLEGQRLESLELVEAAVPRVEDLVELDHLLSQLVHCLATCNGKVAVVGALRRRSFNLVGQAHERQLEVGVEERSVLIGVLAELEHGCGRLERCVDQHRL